LAVAEHIDRSTAPLDEKLRRFLRALAVPSATYFYDDGFPKATIGSEAYAFLADMEAGRLNVTCGVRVPSAAQPSEGSDAA
jgi:hypothetical protein